MKKIISILCIMAMVLSLAAFSVNAADNELVISLKSQTADETVLSLNMNTTETVASYSIYIDVANALTAGAGVSTTLVNGSKATYNANQKMVLVTFAPTDGTTLTGNVELATITLTNVTSAFDIIKKAESSRTKLVITAKDPNGGTDIQVQNNFDVAGLTFNVAPFVPEQPEPEEEKVVMTAAPFITEVATSTEANGWQAGQAVALQFTTADLAKFVAMNWKLTVAGANKFAKVDDAAFATIQATDAETVDVFASFIVNTAENVEATPITAVSAGFKKADGTVVEAE